MEISSSDYDLLNSIFQKLKKDNKYIIQIVFQGQLKTINRETFEDILKHFTYKESNGGLEWKFQMNSKLEVRTENDEYFLRLDDVNKVKKLWQFGIDSVKEEDNDYHLEVIKELYFDKFNSLQFNLVEQSSKAVDKKFLSDLENDKILKTYRYTNYYEIKEPKYGYSILMSEIREKESVKRFKDSRTIDTLPAYEMSIKIENGNIHDDTDISEMLNNVANILRWQRELMQGSTFVISMEDQSRVIDSFRKLTNVTLPVLKNEHFVLAEPVDILRRNFHETDSSPYVKKNHAICYLPRGELSFLYIPENFNKSVDNKMFIIERTFNVIHSGKVLDSFENSLLEGYYVKKENMFYITDILFLRGEDIRLKKFFVKAKGGETSRFDKLLEFYREGVQKSRYLDAELGEQSTSFKIAQYLFGDDDVFVKNFTNLYENVNGAGFEVEGIYMKSYTEHYPLKGGYSYQLFQWRFPQFRTIDFLVKTEKDGGGRNDKVNPLQLSSDQKDATGKIIYYKTLNLHIGGYRNVYDQKKKEYKKIFTITDFAPKGVSEDQDQVIGKANIPLNNLGRMMTMNELTDNQEEIRDDTIVEFAFKKMYGDKTNEFLWTPVSLNHHKTKQYKSGDIVYGASETYANHMWSALSNPITAEMILENRVPEEEVTKYYETNTFRFKKYPYQTLHNQVVKDGLISSVAPAIMSGAKGVEGSLLDLASGIGGDLMKWKNGRYEKVIGVEYNKENIEFGMDSYKKAPRPKPYVQYIWGNASKLIFPEFASAMDHNAKVLMKKTFLSKYQYDVVSCQFALHYFFENEIAIRSFLQNVNDNLKVGGYFIGTSFDGKRVFETLKGMKKPLEGFVGDDLLWKLTKDYNIRTFDDKKGSFGHAVDVYIPTIGTTNKEYLVPYAYFEKLAKEYGLEVVEIKGFGEVFESVPKDSKYYNAIHEMSDAEKQFSFLNNQFKFVKKENTSDKTYKKLIELMQKEEKKAKKETKGGNGKIRIVIRSENKNRSPSPKNRRSPSPKKVSPSVKEKKGENIKVINIDNNVKNIKIK
jgi:mRNA (guanine-N7-)-methyltransferase